MQHARGVCALELSSWDKLLLGPSQILEALTTVSHTLYTVQLPPTGSTVKRMAPLIGSTTTMPQDYQYHLCTMQQIEMPVTVVLLAVIQPHSTTSHQLWLKIYAGYMNM